jgi:hypothetical protein
VKGTRLWGGTFAIFIDNLNGFGDFFNHGTNLGAGSLPKALFGFEFGVECLFPKVRKKVSWVAILPLRKKPINK